MMVSIERVKADFVLAHDSISELVQQRAELIDPAEALEIFYQATNAVGTYLKTLEDGGVNVNRLNRLCLASKAAFIMGYEEALTAVAEANKAACEELRDTILNG